MPCWCPTRCGGRWLEGAQLVPDPVSAEAVGARPSPHFYADGQGPFLSRWTGAGAVYCTAGLAVQRTTCNPSGFPLSYITVSLPRLTGTSRKNSCLQVCPPPVLSTAVLMPSLSLGLGLPSSLLPNTSSPYCVTVELRIIGWVHAHNPTTLGG